MCSLCKSYNYREEFERILHEIHLTPLQKQVIMSRYVHILEHMEKRVRSFSRIFYLGHMIITVGSLLVPALLSIQNSSASSAAFSLQIYWATFTISLMVTMFNGILTLFKIDKKYYFLNTTIERLRTEGWQYVGLTGRYSGQLLETRVPPTHQNQFVFFTHQVEKIKMKQIEEEYYKSDEKLAQNPKNQIQSQISHELYPPSPDQPLALIATDAPQPVTEAVKSIIRSQTFQEIPSILTDETEEKKDTVITFRSSLNL
jgi:hypothetical protein